MTQPVRIGIIGVGIMGAGHAMNFKNITRATLSAVCDTNRPRADEIAALYNVPAFYSVDELIASDSVDAVMVVTPHYSHTTIGIAALEAGLHVLVEKPISAHKADAERLLAAHTNKKQIFSTMFNQRTDPHYSVVRDLIQAGAIGRIIRVNWIITNWFRPEIYYRSGSWRATWSGEGGGVLLNQCPHNLDLLCWLCGKPSRVRAFCKLGKWHDIEVEDDVTAYLEFENGATGVFVTTTGEAPGTNRLEISGELGKIVVENGLVRHHKNSAETSQFSKETKAFFDQPACSVSDIAVEGSGGQHTTILQNFVDAILDGTPLLAPVAEGMNSLELANAMLYSSLTDSTIALPLDSALYEKKLHELQSSSRFVKTVHEARPPSLAGSFGRA